MAGLDTKAIRVRYKDEDGDFVNLQPDDPFVMNEMICTARQIADRDYKKIYIKAHEINSPAPWKTRKLDATEASFSNSRVLLTGAGPKQQLTYGAGTYEGQAKKRLDSKQQELQDNLTVLKIQLTSAQKQLEKMQKQIRGFHSLSDIRARLCGICHKSGPTKTTCVSNPYVEISCCKIWEKTSWI